MTSPWSSWVGKLPWDNSVRLLRDRVPYPNRHSASFGFAVSRPSPLSSRDDSYVHDGGSSPLHVGSYFSSYGTNDVGTSRMTLTCSSHESCLAAQSLHSGAAQSLHSGAPLGYSPVPPLGFAIERAGTGCLHIVLDGTDDDGISVEDSFVLEFRVQISGTVPPLRYSSIPSLE